MKQEHKGSTTYCHFSFKRPKGKGYGIFAVALYLDFDGKVLLAKSVTKYKLWKDQQFITAIQAYENALYTIHKWQGRLKEKDITHVMLVTDNSTLAGWIENPRKRREYSEYMLSANRNYRAGGSSEIQLEVGLCETRDYEKSYKYCQESMVTGGDESLVRVKLNYDGTMADYNIDPKAKMRSVVGVKDYASVFDILSSESELEAKFF